jgi:phosphate-selective porin OprO/OprP
MFCVSRITAAALAGALLLHAEPARGRGADDPSAPVPADVRIAELEARIRALESALAAATQLEPVSPSPSATASAHALDALEERIDALDQQIRIVGRQLEINREQAAEAAKTTPIVGAGKSGFALQSADGAFQVRFRGYLQSDGRAYAGETPPPGADTFLLRRVRPVLEGTVFRNFDFKLMPDFGGGTTVLQDAYLDLKFGSAVKIRTGKFKPPVGLERLASATELPFVERALPTNLVPNRDVGVMVFGDLASARVSYAVGAFNGVVDGGSSDADDGDSKDLAARVFLQPFKTSRRTNLEGLGFGVAGTYGNQRGTLTATNLPAFRSGGQLVFFRFRTDTTQAGTTFADGAHWRVTPQGHYYTGPWGVLAEYAYSRQFVRRDAARDGIGTRGWQVATTYVLTGEAASYRGVTPARAFDASTGAWGALELVARVNELEVDDAAFPVFANPATAARRARAWAVGANWYLNRAVKVTANYEDTHFLGGGAEANRDAEHALLTRFQVAF